jgi:hypothetical protein
MLRLIREHKIDRVLELGSRSVPTLVDGDLAVGELPDEDAAQATDGDAGQEAEEAPGGHAEADAQGQDEGEATQA